MDPANGAAKLDTTAEFGTPSGGSSLVDVFDNPLIWKKIGSYLNMVDLLSCRLVNSGFHCMVMNETDFLNRCLVSLKPNQITRNILGSTDEPWRNVELVFGNPGGAGCTSVFSFDENELEWLYPIVSNVDSLSLKMKLGTKGRNFYPVLKRLLNAPKKLRAFAIEPIFLRDRAQDIEDWKDTFKDLEEFEVLEPPSGWQNDTEGWKTKDYFDDCVLCAFALKMKDIRVLKRYYPESLFVADENRRILAVFETFLLPIMLARIASASTNTLKHVTFPEPGIICDQGRPEEFVGWEFAFPSLESATFHLKPDSCPTEIIREYLLALPMLKELDVTVFLTLPRSILNAIRERSNHLRTLKIRSPEFDGSNWQFLKEAKIENFELGLMYSGKTVTLPDEALNCLPSTIKRLCLVGRLPSNPIPALARLNPSLVTELEFINSGDCFTDDTIQYILENFKMLRKLNVTNAKRVTDAGFVASSESGSLSGIKGLKSLVLKECGSITNAILREIRFLELSHLDLFYNKGVQGTETEDDWKEMLQNNPSALAWMTHNGKR